MTRTNKSIIALIIVVFIVCFPSGIRAAQDVPQEVLDACYSVVRIEAENVSMILSGSGFVIKSDRNGTLIVTNAHVISDGMQNISVWVTNEEKQLADVVSINEQYDLAVIRLERTVDARPLKISTDVFQGMSVYAVGYPAAADSLSEHEAHTDQDATITDGLISAIRESRIVSYGPELSLRQINADLNPGNSGGPLLNSEGEVIGVNTLGVIDSQGIYGAIASAELLRVLDAAGIDLNTDEQNIPWWMIVVAGAAAICVILLTMILLRRHGKRKKMSGPVSQCSALPLTDYIRNWPGDLEDAGIVSILMPLANQLRDMHLNGKLYLKLSPHVLSATAQGVVLSQINPPDFTIAEFSSPEQLTGGAVSMRSDVFSFFRVMDYLRNIQRPHVGGDTYPAHPIDCECQDTSFLDRAIARGLSTDAEKRFPSMQDVIYELAPLNHGIPQKYTEVFLPSAPKANKEDSSRRPIVLRKTILFASLALVGLFLGFEAFCYFRAEKNIEALEFTQAYETMNRVLFADKLLPDDWAYLQAGVEMENGNYDAAVAAFTQLGDYKRSTECVSEAKYRKAAYLADQGQFLDAANIYKELASYRDCADKHKTTINRLAYYLLENENFEGALARFKELEQQGYAAAGESIKETYYYWACSLIDKEEYIAAYEKLLNAGDYPGVSVLLPSLKETAYYYAVDLYRQGDYVNAKKGFKLLESFLDTKYYLILINVHTTYSLEPDYIKTQLFPLIGFEDASDIILSDWSVAKYFLEGKWSGSGRYLYFLKQKDGSYYSSSDVPWSDFGNYYDIVDGYYVLENEDTGETRKIYQITIINQDCIVVYAFKNSSSYTLYRQG